MNLNQSWGLKIDKEVYKKLSRFPKRDAERITYMIESLARNPYFGDIDKIKGEDDKWRRRIGNYRVFYNIKQRERTVEVVLVERRSSNTY